MSTSSAALPSGVSPPLTTDNANDHSGVVVVIAAFYVVLVLTALLARIFASYSRHKPSMQPDDYIFGILVALSFAQASLVLAGVHYGWGKRVEAVTTVDEQMLKIIYAADISSILVLGVSKLTSCVFYEKLFSTTHRRLIRTTLGMIALWILFSVITLAVRCSRGPWLDISTTQCTTLFSRWQAITAVDVITEVLLCCYSALAVRSVRISMTSKLVVFMALESRLVLIPLAAIRLYYVKSQVDSKFPTLSGAYATVTTEIYLAMSVVCLVTAFLKSFVAVYVDENGISYTEGVSGSKSRSRSRSKSINLGSENTVSTNIGSNTSTSKERLRGWEREEDPMINPVEARGGLQIVKTVQLSVRDESIELPERATASS